jgi:RNA polymerase sigma-70 factor (ECF subfamily)
MTSDAYLSLESAEAFRALYERAHLLVFRYAFGLTGGPPEEAEDLAAETFLRAWRSRRSFSGSPEAAIGWLLKITRNLVVDAHRRRQARPPEVPLGEMQLIYPGGLPEELAERRQEINRLWSQMQALQERHREIIVLRYWLGWQVKEIAAHLEMSENTVSVEIHRILERLRQGEPGDEG